MTAEKSKPAGKANVPVDDREVVFTRIIDAPRPVVFQAFTDPKKLAQWWGPHGFTNPVCELDVRPGGALRIAMRGPDGTLHPVKGVYGDIVAPEKLVMIVNHSELPDDWHDMVNPNRDKAVGRPALEAVQTITLEELDGKTKLTIRVRMDSAEICKAMVKMGMKLGWALTLERLETVAAGESLDKELVITRTFNAPRDLVFKAWTEPERLRQWWVPKGMALDVDVKQFDLRPGGVFRYSMKTPDGRVMWSNAVYREITPPERIVFVNSFADDQGEPQPNPYVPNYPLEVQVTVSLYEQNDGKTFLTFRGRPIHATAVERETYAKIRDGMSKYFAGAFALLEEQLAPLAA